MVLGYGHDRVIGFLTRTRTNTIPNGTKANAAGFSGLRTTSQKGKNGRRGVVDCGVGHFVGKRQQKMPGGKLSIFLTKYRGVRVSGTKMKNMYQYGWIFLKFGWAILKLGSAIIGSVDPPVRHGLSTQDQGTKQQPVCSEFGKKCPIGIFPMSNFNSGSEIQSTRGVVAI